MLKYNLKGFFTSRIIQDDQYITNGHLIFNKSIITKAQRGMLDKMKSSSKNLDKAMDILNVAKEFHSNNKNKQQFIPTDISIGNNNALYDHDSDLGLGEEYYNFFTKRGCKIYKGKGKFNPAVVTKNDIVVGVLLPIRFGDDSYSSMIQYNKYIDSKVS